MKKRRIKIIAFVMFLVMFISVVQGEVKVQASTKSYITQKNFKGNYYPQGKNSETGMLLTIDSIKNSKVTFMVDQSTYSKVLETGKITAKIKGNKASFTYSDNWDNKGKGSIVFNEDKTISFTIKTTQYSDMYRAAFDAKNFKMGHKDMSTSVYMIMASQITDFTKKGGKLNVKTKSNLYEGPLYPISQWCYYRWADCVFETDKTAFSYKIDKNCKWRSTDINDLFDCKGEKSSYSDVKSYVDIAQNGYGDMAVFIYVKNKKVVKVVVAKS